MKLKKTAMCAVCGKEFELVHGKGKLVCSKECLGRYRSMIFKKNTEISETCKCCGKEFKHEKWTESKGFCSRTCYWKYRRENSEKYEHVFDERKKDTHETRKCEICGKEFSVYKNYTKRFCSNECRVKYQSTEDFKEKKNATMLERYGVKSKVALNASSNKERNKEERERKYNELCDKSDLELIGFVDMHVLHVRCKKCGKEFITNNLSYIPYEKIECKCCGSVYKFNKPMSFVCDILDEIGIEYTKNDRNAIKPYEIDIFIPSRNIGLEINGNFWHSELCGKDKNYHIRKTKLADSNGIKLIHIFEDEIVYKGEIVKSRILNMLGKSEKRIFARKCEVVEVSSKEKKEFIDKNHIQGDTNSSINIGLKYNGELVSVMTFGKERVIYKPSSSEGYYELIRFANKLGTSVVGGFSKILNHFINVYSPKSIKTFCDSRWSGINPLNTVYSVVGFKYVGLSKPNYWYMHKSDMLTRKHRYNFTKYSILSKNPNLDRNKTEWQLMMELGYNRIWDCGNLKFEMIFI